MARLSTAFVLLCLLALGCEEDGSNPQVRIEIVDPNGENAAARIIEGRLRVRVRQGDVSLPCADGACEAEIRGGNFDLALPIESFLALTTIQAEIEGGDELLFGAVPTFQVIGEGLETGELPVRLVMMPRGICAPIVLFNLSSEGRPRLVAPRRDMAAVLRRNSVLLAGGMEESGASARADFFDRIVVEMRLPLADAPGAVGAARGIALDDDNDNSLVVGERSYIWELPPRLPPSARNVDLHAGADFSSALVRVGSETAVIGGTATDELVWLDERGVEVGRGTLTAPRAFAAAAAGTDGALVVGGGPVGGPGGEWIAPAATSVAVDGLPDGSGGWLVPSPTRETFLWIGAHGTDTHLITGCPTECTVDDGPSWERARPGASGVLTAAGAFWIVGGDDIVGADDSRLIDLVTWTDEEMPQIGPGPRLVEARAGAALAEHAAGIVLVIGGEGPEGMHDSVEMCMPEMGLDPI